MTRKTNNTFYVSVEGETEIRYLDRLQHLINTGNYPYNLKIIKKVTDPLSFAKSKNIGFNEYPFYHVCDYESNNEEDYQRFLKFIDNVSDASKIVKSGYKLAYTNFCFELWLILHKKKFTKSCVNKKKYLDQINQTFQLNCKSWSEIKKEDVMNKILQTIEIEDVIFAINNAKEIMSDNVDKYQLIGHRHTKFYKENPSLNVHEFIELVLKRCKVLEGEKHGI